MTEREYIDATNLAKIRAARSIVRDVLPMTSEDEKDQESALLAMAKIEDRLARAVQTDG